MLPPYIGLTFPHQILKSPPNGQPADRVETLPFLVGGNSKVTNQNLWFFMNTPGNSTSSLGATRNSVCSRKNVITFYFYP